LLLLLLRVAIFRDDDDDGSAKRGEEGEVVSEMALIVGEGSGSG
jgi:hypothetical protein